MEMTAPIVEIDVKSPVQLTPAELKNFAQEIVDMVIAGEKVDIGRAIRNAKYLAEIDRRLANVDAGKNLVQFTAEEWSEFAHENHV